MKALSLVLIAGIFVAAGVLHFVRPGLYVRIIPPFLPFPLAPDKAGMGIAPVWLWLRLPLQFGLIAWVWWATRTGG